MILKRTLSRLCIIPKGGVGGGAVMGRKRTICPTTKEDIAIGYSPFLIEGSSVVDYQIGFGGNILFELWNINS